MKIHLPFFLHISKKLSLNVLSCLRSLPELSQLKQTSIRGFTYSSPKPNSLPEITISASWDGDLVMVTLITNTLQVVSSRAGFLYDHLFSFAGEWR